LHLEESTHLLTRFQEQAKFHALHILQDSFCYGTCGTLQHILQYFVIFLVSHWGLKKEHPPKLHSKSAYAVLHIGCIRALGETGAMGHLDLVDWIINKVNSQCRAVRDVKNVSLVGRCGYFVTPASGILEDW